MIRIIVLIFALFLSMTCASSQSVNCYGGAGIVNCQGYDLQPRSPVDIRMPSSDFDYGGAYVRGVGRGMAPRPQIYNGPNADEIAAAIEKRQRIRQNEVRAWSAVSGMFKLYEAKKCGQAPWAEVSGRITNAKHVRGYFAASKKVYDKVNSSEGHKKACDEIIGGVKYTFNNVLSGKF